MIYKKNIPQYSLAAMILIGISQGSALAEGSIHLNDSSQEVSSSSAEDNIASKQRAATEVIKRRKSLLDEAVTANEEMFKAIASLQKKDKTSASKSLSEAARMLNRILARDPSLKLAVIDVRSSIVDVTVTPDVIKDIISKAKRQLNDGEIQQVRALLAPMVSEIRTSTDSLPMATYPTAIYLAIKDIDEGKLKEAEQLLRDTLNTVVTIDEIVPLPPVKAEKNMLEAERLLKTDEAKNRQKANELLNQAKQNLTLGKLLGYGDFKEINEEIASIQSKIKSGSTDTNLFSKMKDFFRNIRNKL